MQPPTPGIIAYTNIQSITNQSINPGLNSLMIGYFEAFGLID